MDRLLEEVDVLETRGDLAATEVASIELDSAQVRPGALFCCVPGLRVDGHLFAPEAVAHGAVALLVERPLDLSVPQAVVGMGHARSAVARAARALYGDPARSLVSVGVTGTNGKTTVTRMLGPVLDAAGWPCIVVGTLDGARTTPEAPVLQRVLAEARDEGRRAVAMEVSSHALVQERVEGIRFSVAVFTNLGHDHLDYHGTMERYFEAKASLFTPEHAVVGVTNTSDSWGRRLLERSHIPMTGFSETDALDAVSVMGRTGFTWRGRHVELAQTGVHNVVNALAAAAAASALGIGEDVIVEGLASAGPVSGRFEVVDVHAPFTAVVDYAHTPDALGVAIDSARRLAGDGRVICVFGCGGDRDREKRPLMGLTAVERADLTIVTSDNARGEEPASIIEDIMSGVHDATSVVAEPDRARAIALAVSRARRGDVVLVAGKGPERVLECGGRRIPFDDRQVVRDAVAGTPATPSAAPGRDASGTVA